MEKYLINQLGSNYRIIDENSNGQHIIKVYQNMDGFVNVETYVKLISSNNENLWRLFEVQKDNEYLKGEFTKYDISIFALYMATMSIFGQDRAKREARNELRNAGNDAHVAERILDKYVSRSYFSLFKESKGSINLEQTNDNYNSYYLSLAGDKIPIILNRRAPNIFVIIYNYAIKLQTFDEIMRNWTNKVNLDIEETEKIKRIFLGK